LALSTCGAPYPSERLVVLGRSCRGRRAFRLPLSPTLVEVEGSGSFLRDCAEGDTPDSLLSFDPEEPTWLFSAGREIALAHDDAWPESEVSIESPPGVLRASCDATAPIQLASAGYELQALLAPTSDALYVEFNAVEAASMGWTEYSGSTNQHYSWNVETCLACESGIGAACEVSGRPHQGRFWMKITWSEPFVREYLALRLFTF
jgi:hypothetical protein